ncbi:enoyl-[acyl-carrier-protein] reductase, mitochondrial-like [Balamuthia mandrillaris]
MRLRTITSAAPLRESLFTGRAQVGARASLYRPAATAAANCVFVGGRRGYAASAGALPTEATVARYREYGNPHNVLKVEKEPLPAKLKEGEILLAMLCAPVNPADLNMVEGVYPTRPTVPAVGGNEGVAEVLAVGPGVQGIAVNDWVIPKKPGFGTWRTHAVCSQQQVTKVKQNIKPEYIATLAVNPCTALRLLEDFVQLKEGDTVIQNGANSAVGQAFMQLANLRGVKTINIVRKRENWDQLVERMKGYGAYIVVPPENLGTAQFQRLISDLPKPKLALNCVGGPTATEMVRVLEYVIITRSIKRTPLFLLLTLTFCVRLATPTTQQ